MSEPRPKYETAEDLENESRFVRYIEQRGTRVVKLNAMQYHIDFAIANGNYLKAFVEYKRRQVESTAYPDIILALSKYLKLIELSKLMWTAFYVEFNDKLMYYKIDAADQLQIKMAGRRDRGDSLDVEPCVHIPAGSFRDV